MGWEIIQHRTAITHPPVIRCWPIVRLVQDQVIVLSGQAEPLANRSILETHP